MQAADTEWFRSIMEERRISQRGLAKLLGCNASSVNRLVNGKRPIRFDEAESLAVLLGTSVADVLSRAGIEMDEAQGVESRLVGYIDGAGEAYVDWGASGETVPSLPSLPRSAVAIQYRTTLSAWESLDGWVVYVEPPEGRRIDDALNRLSLVTLESGMTLIGFLRRGYREGTYNVSNFGAANLESAVVKWATPVLLLRP